MTLWRRDIPLLITFLTGIIYVLNNVGTISIGSTTLGELVQDLNVWVLIVAAFAMGVASVNLLRLHGEKVQRRREGWGYSLVLIATMLGYMLIGALGTTYQIPFFADLTNLVYTNVQSPLGATMWAMVGFFICSSAYRAFRARNVEGTIMLVAGILVMLGNAPIGESIWGGFPVLSKWLLDIPNTAGQRAIMIGAAIGAFTTALRTVTGIDRRYMGTIE